MPDKNKRMFFFPPLWWQYIQSDSDFDFLLRIGPLSKDQIKTTPINHHPPPGYGLAPGCLKKENIFSPNKKYSLFLFPGKISKWFLLFSFLLPLCIFLPFLTHKESPYFYGLFFYVPFSLLYWALSFWAYRHIYYKKMPPVLSNAWEKWPPAAYHLFLSVPHKVNIIKPDRNQEEHLYWKPDIPSNMSRQATVFAKNTQSLQEVILNFAIFEFFFQRPEKENQPQTNIPFLQSDTPDKNTPPSENNSSEKKECLPEDQRGAINQRHWFIYLFAPIWINYLLILMFLFAMTSLPVEKTPDDTAWFVLANLPYNFLPVITIWFLLTLTYIQHIISSLEDLHGKIRKGVFDTHLERVPQAILQELANIPQEQHINNGIQYIKKAMGWVSSIALLGFLGVLEILSQGYGSQAMRFYFY